MYFIIKWLISLQIYKNKLLLIPKLRDLWQWHPFSLFSKKKIERTAGKWITKTPKRFAPFKKCSVFSGQWSVVSDQCSVFSIWWQFAVTLLPINF
ncbi:MAG TPA: hypothetical protein DIU01_01585 [Flavobacterium sp.]|nr:hypothetical protein [Flavobacterium sp.]